jgi:prepilin-type N-terminal cleavage/methylation domain-containing protein
MKSKKNKNRKLIACANVDREKIKLTYQQDCKILKKHYGIKKKGFSYIELLCSLVVVAILSAVAVPSMQHRIDLARKKATIENTIQVNLAVQEVMLNSGTNGVYFSDIPDRYNRLNAMLEGGLESMNVDGYIFLFFGLDDCYIGNVYFRGVETTNLYMELN